MARALASSQQVQCFGDVDVKVGAFTGNQLGVIFDLVRVDVNWASRNARSYGYVTLGSAFGRNASGLLDGHLARQLVRRLLALGPRGVDQGADVGHHLLAQSLVQWIASKLLIYPLIDQRFGSLLQCCLTCLVSGLHHVLQNLDGLRHGATLGSRCAGRGVFGYQCTGSFFDVVGLILGQGLACIGAFAKASVGQRAIRVGCPLHAEARQNLLAHAKVGFHVGHENAAQLVVELVNVLWPEALGQRSNFHVSHVLFLAQQALKKVLALLLSSKECFFDWFTCRRGERIKQARQPLLVLVDTCLDRFQLLGAQLLQQLCLAAEQRAVHGAFGHVEHKACVRDPRIG